MCTRTFEIHHCESCKSYLETKSTETQCPEATKENKACSCPQLISGTLYLGKYVCKRCITIPEARRKGLKLKRKRDLDDDGAEYRDD